MRASSRLVGATTRMPSDVSTTAAAPASGSVEESTAGATVS